MEPSTTPKTAPTRDSSDSEDDSSEDEEPKARQIKPVPRSSAASSAESSSSSEHSGSDSNSSSSSSSDSDSDSDSDPGSGFDASPETPVVTLTKKAHLVKDPSSDSGSSSDEENSSSESGEDVKMQDSAPAIVTIGIIVAVLVVLEPMLIPCFRKTKGGGWPRSPDKKGQDNKRDCGGHQT